MEIIDRETARRVWQRVRAGRSPTLTPRQRQLLTQMLQRSRANLAACEALKNHPHYTQAIHHLTTQTQEHIKMLRQMLAQL